MAENRFRQFVEDAPQGNGGNRFARFAEQPSPEQSGPEGNRGALAFLNRGISTVLGGPVDLVNAGLGAAGVPVSDTPFLGSESIAGGMDAIGIRAADRGAQPENLGEYVGRGVGEAVGSLPFLGAGTGALQAAQSPVARGVGGSMMQPFVQSPGRALSAEASAGAGAGAALYATDEIQGERGRGDPVRTLAEIGGAVAGGMGPNLAGRAIQATPIAGGAIRGAKKAVVPFTRAGATERARDRIRGLAEDPEAAARALMEEPAVRGPDGGAALTPAQRTGDRRLMGLEKAVRDTDPPTDLALRQREATADQAIAEAIRAPGEGRGVEATRSFLSENMERRIGRLDRLVSGAGERAQNRVNRLAPERRASESATIVRNELDNALRRARGEERSLWQRVPENVSVPTTQTRTAYRQLLEETPGPQMDNIPAKARQFLDPEASNQAFGAAETVKEMQGLYSAMREAARQSRASGEMNSARMADNIADAILRDFDATEVAGEAGRLFGEARTFSRQLNERFTRGSIGRVMGHAREGGVSVPAELTLDRTIGRGGLGAAVSTDEIRRAVGDSPDAEGAMQDFLRRRFSEHAIRDGEFSSRRAQDFLRANSELLDRFPQLKQQMGSAEQAQALANRVSSRAGEELRRLRDPNITQASRFLNAPVDQEIQSIFRARDPRAAAAQLRRAAAQDPTGDALRGLKGGFVDFLMDRARTGNFNEFDQPILSGRAIRGALADDKISKVAGTFLSESEMRRLNAVARELANLETARGNVPDVGQVMSDTPNKIIDIIGRTLAARSGARLGQGTSGASLLTAGFASQRMKRILGALTNDHAEALIREAVQDPDLFRILLSPSAARQERSATRLMETLTAVTGGEFARTMEQVDQPERPPLEMTVNPAPR